MKNFVLAATMALISASAFPCPLSQSLVDHYGISFAGFKTAIPMTKAPDQTSRGPFVRTVVKDKSGVSDGFRHTVVMDTQTKKVWILRTSGFVSVYQWFGPVYAINASLKNCRLEPMPARLQGPSNR